MDKSPDAFRTISEVAELLETPAHVLRFWESRFPQIKPVKRAGGRRYYRPADMALLSGIRRLLHEEGMTIRGVQKILREQGVKHVSGLAEDESLDADLIDADTEGESEETVETSAPIALFPTKPTAAAPAETEPDATAVEAPAPDAEAIESAELEAATTVAAPAAEVPEPEALSPEGEIALEEALSGPFIANEALDEANVERVEPPTFAAREEPAAPEAAIAPELQRAESGTDAPEFPFDSPVTAPEDSAAEAALSSESSGPLAEPPVAAVPETPVMSAKTAQPVADAPAAPVEISPSDAAPAAPVEGAEPAKAALPGPLPVFQEITGHWLPADIRTLRRGALAPKRVEAEALMKRLERLRNRVGDLGRVPRR